MTIAMRFSLLLALPVSLFSQTAELSGLIKDPQSTAVPNASVELRNEDTGGVSRTKSNANGIYVVPALSPGKYDLTAQATGFKTATHDGIVLQVEQRARLDITLELGSVEEKVTVAGDAPLVDTTDGSVSTVIDRQFVENIPLNGRTFQSLITLTPGVVTTPTPVAGEQGQFSVVGQRAGSNYFSIDGVSANFGTAVANYNSQTANGGLPAFSALGSTASLVSVDALQEFRIESSTYAPEYGRQSGGQVLLVTRSGTNTFHGTAFEYLRNDAFDANDWFANSTAHSKPRERQNDFGGVFGGPVVKDKTFFFFSYEGLRVTQPLFQLSDVPSLAARASAPPNVKAIIDAYPLPNGPNTNPGLAQLAASSPNHGTLDSTSFRIDHSINSKINLFGRYNHSPSSVVAAYAGFSTPSNPFPTTQEIDTGTVGLTVTVSPAVTNDFRFNYSRAHGEQSGELNSFGGAAPLATGALLASFQNQETGNMAIKLTSGRNSNYQIGLFGNNSNRQSNITDSLSVSKDTHLLTFGFDWRRLTPVQIPDDTSISYIWFTAPAMISGATPDETYVRQDHSNIRQRFLNFSAFAQDTWKVSRRLTLTYGVRWEYNPPPVETNGSSNAPYTLSNTSNLAAAVLLPQGSALWHADWKNFAPRVGLGYHFGSDTRRPLVLRAGFGQFFDLGTDTAGFLNNGQGWYPYSLLNLLCYQGAGSGCTNVIPYNGPTPSFAFGQGTTSSLRAFDSHLKLPYALEWSVALEKSLSATQSFKVTYLGSAGRRLLRDDVTANTNPATTPLFATIYLTGNSGYSNYNAMQLQYQRRLAHGLQALVSYSRSHSLDLNSADVTFSSPPLPSTLYNIRQDYGNSDFDIRHSFSAALTYNVPAVRTRNSFVAELLRDWSISSINIARSGTPFNIFYTPATPGSFTNGSGAAYQLRPDQVPGQPVWISDPNAPDGKRLNLAAFTIPSLLTQGSEGRNSISGFPVVEMDLGLRRQFNLTERVHLQFQADAFNIINHPNFGNPLNTIGTCALGKACTSVFGWGTSQAMLNQNLGSGNFHGTPLNALYQIGGPRSLQLSVKLQF